MISTYKPRIRLTSALALAVLLAGCAGGVKPTVYTSAAIDTNAPVLLLGEVHDNALGHKLRYELLRKRVEAGWRPVIVMEQFDRENQGKLDQAVKGCVDAQCVIQVAGGARWDWQLYYPVIQLALTWQLPLVAGNLSRDDASRVVRDGVASSFDPASVKAWHLDQPLPAAIRDAQQQEIAVAHCNMLPDMMVGGLVDAQVARDIWMAKIVLDQRPRDVVLIAGNDHVRKDVGVGYWLHQVQPELAVRSVGFVESVAATGRYDNIQMLAPQQRSDPCKQVKK